MWVALGETERERDLTLCLFQHLRSLRAYFQRGGVGDDELDTDLCSQLLRTLQLNCLTTRELMLQYYSQLADNLVSEIVRGTTSIFIHETILKRSHQKKEHNAKTSSDNSRLQ